MNDLIKINSNEYKKWITDVSNLFKQSQIKAAVKVNDEMLHFYWTLGRDISALQAKAAYGLEFYKTLSHNLQNELPDIKSFSVTNLKYMRYFYEMYPDAENRPQVDDDFEAACDIFFIPWGRHKLIIDKCKEYKEKELKDALMGNIQKFLLELGKGFAFVSREYRLEVGNTEQFIDM
jgi:predicted nuclease of restriction endonuclease-like (RecB) superfamily